MKTNPCVYNCSMKTKNPVRRALTDHERVDMAIARFRHLAETGRLVPIEQLASTYGREAAQVSRAIAEAFARGLVSVAIRENEPGIGRRILEWERKLKEKYDRLRVCLVADSPPLRLREADTLAYSDDVHRRLGAVMAEQISSGSLIRDGELIGIGAGRGVYETVRALQRHPAIRAQGVALVSLSGLGYGRHHSVRRNLILDADFISSLMGQAFEPLVALNLVSSSLIHDSRPTLNPEPWILQDDRLRPLLNTALLGVGVFAPGNRFFEESAPETTFHQPLYDSIREPLRSLRAMARKLERPGYSALADLGYHLFVVPPKHSNDAELELIRTLARQADTINRSLLSAHTAHFDSMKTITVIAGTELKAAALDYMLNATHLPPINLCTDELAARQMLAA